MDSKVPNGEQESPIDFSFNEDVPFLNLRQMSEHKRPQRQTSDNSLSYSSPDRSDVSKRRLPLQNKKLKKIFFVSRGSNTSV